MELIKEILIGRVLKKERVLKKNGGGVCPATIIIKKKGSDWHQWKPGVSSLNEKS